MLKLDVVRDIAKQILMAPTFTAKPDNSLWDRAERLVRNVEDICRLPELTKAGPQIDNFCLVTATYFSDAGLVGSGKSKRATAKLFCPGSNGNGLLESSADVVSQKLKGVLEEAKIQKINKIITESGNRFTRWIEARILADARNLDDVGAVGIFNELKRHIIDGKGVSDVVASWERKLDYGYWQARLKEGFHFEFVRRVAEERLSRADSFMKKLRSENEARDLEDLRSRTAFA